MRRVFTAHLLKGPSSGGSARPPSSRRGPTQGLSRAPLPESSMDGSVEESGQGEVKGF